MVLALGCRPLEGENASLSEFRIATWIDVSEALVYLPLRIELSSTQFLKYLSS